jgi:hypothetical protein
VTTPNQETESEMSRPNAEIARLNEENKKLQSDFHTAWVLLNQNLEKLKKRRPNEDCEKKCEELEGLVSSLRKENGDLARKLNESKELLNDHVLKVKQITGEKKELAKKNQNL